MLDPGGFGSVTITKSITLNGTHGAGFGSILSAGTAQGVLVNITDPADVRKTVRLVTLNFNGSSTGTDGIRILSATAVNIEDCVLDGFTNAGINDVRSTTGRLNVIDTVVRNTAQSCIRVVPTAGTTTAMLDNVRMLGSTANGGYAQSGTGVNSTLRNCFIVGNSTNGVFSDNGQVTIENCVISHNGVGIFVTAPGIVRLSNTVMTNNGTSINAAGQPQVSSAGNNLINGNTANNQPTGPPVGNN